MKLRSRSFVDGRQHAPVSVTAHLRSWAAGVLDACAAVRVVRASDVRLASWTYEVSGVDLDALGELQTILGAGEIRKRNGRPVLVLTARQAYEIARLFLPLMRGRGRDHLRCIASWATTLGLRGFGRRLDDGVVDLRVQLSAELKRLKQGGRLSPDDKGTLMPDGREDDEALPGDYEPTSGEYEQDLPEQHIQHRHAEQPRHDPHHQEPFSV